MSEVQIEYNVYKHLAENSKDGRIVALSKKAMKELEIHLK